MIVVRVCACACVFARKAVFPDMLNSISRWFRRNRYTDKFQGSSNVQSLRAVPGTLDPLFTRTGKGHAQAQL